MLPKVLTVKFLFCFLHCFLVFYYCNPFVVRASLIIYIFYFILKFCYLNCKFLHAFERIVCFFQPFHFESLIFSHGLTYWTRWRHYETLGGACDVTSACCFVYLWASGAISWFSIKTLKKLSNDLTAVKTFKLW